MILLIVNHWNGCIQFYISKAFDTVLIDINGTTWTDMHPNTWIVRAGIEELPPFEQWSWRTITRWCSC